MKDKVQFFYRVDEATAELLREKAKVLSPSGSVASFSSVVMKAVAEGKVSIRPSAEMKKLFKGL